jgi:homoserine O-acetyltransferase
MSGQDPIVLSTAANKSPLPPCGNSRKDHASFLRVGALSIACGWSFVFLVAAGDTRPEDYPAPVLGTYVIKDFRFASGQTLPEVRIHYRTLGKPQRDVQGLVRNAVLILHGTGGSGENFVSGVGRRWFAGELFGKGQPLDAARYYLIIPDNLGHGKSSKPSDGLHARFPRYGYHDMIRAQYQLLTRGLHVNHLRLAMGTSMGGMHSWLWGELHPNFMDALLPLASLPTQISGRNRMWRKTIIDAIRTDPDWKEGDYKAPPRAMTLAGRIILLVTSNPVLWQQRAPTLKKADEVLERASARWQRLDANDLLYALESSADYDPGPGLEKIKAPLLAINSADDQINPPELGILEKEIKRVKHGRALVIPLSRDTVGHGTHTKAVVWKQHLAKFLKETGRTAKD